ncbi:MAG: hypothetical protein P3W91_005535 [Fervidobacterium sp.]|nr:hypothetical protein [Fervidobacterium sp.]
MKFFKSIGKAVGNIGKAVGTVGGVVGSIFNPKTALIGGLGVLAGGLLGGKKLKGSVSYSAYTPPYAQQGADILNELLKQSPQFAQTIVNIKRPYVEQAKTSFESLQTEIPNWFSRTKGEVSNLYDNLLSQTRDIITSEQTKQNTKLGALGLLNTQAQQWTLADILNRTAFPILQEKTKELTGLAKSEADVLLKYLFMKPDFYAKFGEEMTSIDPFLFEQQYKMDIAKSLMGIPTIVQPFYKKGLLDYLPDFANVGITIAGLRRENKK